VRAGRCARRVARIAAMACGAPPAAWLCRPACRAAPPAAGRSGDSPAALGALGVWAAVQPTSTSSTSILRNTTPGNSALRVSKYGLIIRQGPHQVAEKSTTTCVGAMRCTVGWRTTPRASACRIGCWHGTHNSVGVGRLAQVLVPLSGGVNNDDIATCACKGRSGRLSVARFSCHRIDDTRHRCSHPPSCSTGCCVDCGGFGVPGAAVYRGAPRSPSSLPSTTGLGGGVGILFQHTCTECRPY
jgi:hypothetical protein